MVRDAGDIHTGAQTGLIGTQVLELMQMHPKERLRRVILTASWFIAINVGQFFPENSLRFPWHIIIFS